MARVIPADAPLAFAVTRAVQSGDLAELRQLLYENPELATARVGSACRAGDMSRTLLHALTDWPGHRPNGAAVAAMLIEAGADVNARFSGDHTETPLHWAASSDDVTVLDALIDHGADIEATGAVIGGGTPLSDAVAFGQWKAARRLIERGAKSSLWESAALGLMDRVEGYFAADQRPTSADITTAFWCACHGGQRDAAEYLLLRGADLDWIGYDGLTPLDAARRTRAERVADWLLEQGARSAHE